MDLVQLSASDAAAAIRGGEITSERLVSACLERIAEFEESVHAWAHLDAGHALQQAGEADAARREGKPLGPLHGVPVGVKDIFDTRDMPTEDGTVLHAGRTPSQDAAAVARLHGPCAAAANGHRIEKSVAHHRRRAARHRFGAHFFRRRGNSHCATGRCVAQHECIPVPDIVRAPLRFGAASGTRECHCLVSGSASQ
jgi:hypothetical protein